MNKHKMTKARMILRGILDDLTLGEMAYITIEYPEIIEAVERLASDDIDGDGVKISNFKELVIDGKVHFGKQEQLKADSNFEVSAKVLREYIDNNYIHMPTADTHVGYNRALGDLRDWLRVLEQEENHD